MNQPAFGTNWQNPFIRGLKEVEGYRQRPPHPHSVEIQTFSISQILREKFERVEV